MQLHLPNDNDKSLESMNTLIWLHLIVILWQYDETDFSKSMAIAFPSGLLFCYYVFIKHSIDAIICAANGRFAFSVIYELISATRGGEIGLWRWTYTTCPCYNIATAAAAVELTVRPHSIYCSVIWSCRIMADNWAVSPVCVGVWQ